MPELTVADVELFTGGRLSADDVETYRMLQRALAAARKYCGWHVTPSRTETITVDGPGRTLLSLPTLHLTALTTVVEDSVTLDVSGLTWTERGMVVKRYGFFPACWSHLYRSIVVTMTHGYVSAPDFDAAVLTMVDTISMSTGVSASAGAAGGLIRKRVDDVEYWWSDGTSSSASSEGVAAGRAAALLDQYRILMVA